MNMDWDKLFCEKRERESKTKRYPYRNCFDMDYDRIVYSSSLRRLQDKAQVFPLQENDFTRTRLTHSLEVSAIGRSIGANVGSKLKEKGIFDEEKERKLSSLMLVTGLVHDLGNPPFGHYGEDVIKKWIKEHKNELQLDNEFGGTISDFEKFDGNAQTIRILTRLQFLNDKYGMNFCYGTLATLMKYPWDSTKCSQNKDKFGYFYSEKELCENILKETGIINRHPATYLLEAADDIAYLFADLEDALKKRYLPWKKVWGIFKTELKNNDYFNDKMSSMERIDPNVELSQMELDLISIQNFKIYVQGYFIQVVCDEFIENYDLIMNGKYGNESLLKCSKIVEFEKLIRRECVKYAYNNNEVLSLELVCEEVLNSLLDKFVFAVLDDENYKNTKHSNGKLYALISENFKHIQYYDENGRYNSDMKLSRYQRLQMVIDFVSGMTDSYALNLHNMLCGKR